MVLRQLQVPVSGRVTKVDLQYSLCNKLKISTAGESCQQNDALTPMVRATIPLDVLPFYQELGRLAALTTSDNKLWTKDLRKCPSQFGFFQIEIYLIHSPDKEFDGESMQSYKALRAYQLFEEQHVHNVEFCPSYPTSQSCTVSPLCFFRCQCFPSQDATKQPHRVLVCLDRRFAQPYGGHCRCVSGLGEACSHVAGLLFALEDFVA